MNNNNETTTATATATTGDTTMFYELRSIDAWKAWGGGWIWNANYHLCHLKVDRSLDGVALSRHVAKKLRDEDYLSDRSKGRIRVDDDGDTIVIEDKGTGEPLFALIPAE